MRPEIFLLADEHELVVTLSELLPSAGYGLRVCHEPRSALPEIRRARPGLLIIGSSRERGGIDIPRLELICRDAVRRRLPTLVLLPYPALTSEGPWLRSLRCTVLGRPFLSGVLLDTVELLLSDSHPAAEPASQLPSTLTSASSLS